MGVEINWSASNLPTPDQMKPKGISARIICDSTNWLNKRITTFVLEYPRFIHAELMTHRVFSKNSGSSRAIPTPKIIQSVMEEGVVPLWTQNKSGMQGDDIEDEKQIAEATNIWNQIKKYVVDGVAILNQLKIHKQHANRPLEAFQYLKIILTGTEFDNFFALRDHPDAQPEIQELARCMKKQFEDSLPIYLEPGEWHIPFGDRVDDGYDKLKISVARCARVSYNNFEGKIDFDKDIELYNDLINREPLHASPSEHQARVPTKDELLDFVVGWAHMLDGEYKEHKGKYVSNLSGWIQYRKIIENEKYGQ